MDRMIGILRDVALDTVALAGVFHYGVRLVDPMSTSGRWGSLPWGKIVVYCAGSYAVRYVRSLKLHLLNLYLQNDGKTTDQGIKSKALLWGELGFIYIVQRIWLARVFSWSLSPVNELACFLLIQIRDGVLTWCMQQSSPGYHQLALRLLREGIVAALPVHPLIMGGYAVSRDVVWIRCKEFIVNPACMSRLRIEVFAYNFFAFGLRYLMGGYRAVSPK